MQNERPIISVIMPVYNAVKYVEAAVNSVLAQTFGGGFELILVDDGATDGSGALCDALAERDGRIRVLHKQNGGVSAARNLGLRHAAGEYIAFIDHDDCYLPDFLEKMYRLIRTSGAQSARCGRLNINVDAEGATTSTYACYPTEAETLTNLEFAKKYLKIRGKKLLLTAVWNGIYRRDFLEQHQIEFPEELRVGSEDTAFNIMTFLAGTDIAFLPEILYVHYIRARQSTSADFNDDLIPINIRLANQEREFVRRGAPEDAGLLAYMQFDEFVMRIRSVRDRDAQLGCVRYLLAQIPLEGCPLKYIFQIGGIKHLCWLIFWPLSRLHSVSGFYFICAFPTFRGFVKAGIRWIMRKTGILQE